MSHMLKVAKLYADSGCCGPCGCTKTWADQFQGSPLYKQALAVQKEDAQLDVKRARQRAEQDKLYAEESAARVKVSEIEAELAEWKFANMGIEASKTAAALQEAKAEGATPTGAAMASKYASAPAQDIDATRAHVIEKLVELSLSHAE